MTDFMTKDDELMDNVTAADYLRLKNPKTLTVWRSTKRYPIAYTKVGKSIRYRKSDLDKYLISGLVK